MGQQDDFYTGYMMGQANGEADAAPRSRSSRTESPAMSSLMGFLGNVMFGTLGFYFLIGLKELPLWFFLFLVFYVSVGFFVVRHYVKAAISVVRGIWSFGKDVLHSFRKR